VPRPVPEPAALAAAVEVLRSAHRPLVVAGGGVGYAEATGALREFVEATGIPMAETQAGKGSLPYDHPLAVGAVGSTGTTAANRLAREWDETVQRAYTLGHTPLPAQSEVIGAVNEASAPRDVVVCAAGSMPGDLHKLWRTRDPKGYHVEYGYSCMGYEIAGGLGV